MFDDNRRRRRYHCRHWRSEVMQQVIVCYEPGLYCFQHRLTHTASEGGTGYSPNHLSSAALSKTRLPVVPEALVSRMGRYCCLSGALLRETPTYAPPPCDTKRHTPPFSPPPDVTGAPETSGSNRPELARRSALGAVPAALDPPARRRHGVGHG